MTNVDSQEQAVDSLNKEVDALVKENRRLIKNAEKLLDDNYRKSVSAGFDVTKLIPTGVKELVPDNIKARPASEKAGLLFVSGVTLYAFYDMFKNSGSKKKK